MNLTSPPTGLGHDHEAALDPGEVRQSCAKPAFVTMRQDDRETLMSFEEAVAGIPHVEDEKLAALPGVQRMNSTLVMKQVVNGRPLST